MVARFSRLFARCWISLSTWDMVMPLWKAAAAEKLSANALTNTACLANLFMAVEPPEIQ
jgi:hypothetical protein